MEEILSTSDVLKTLDSQDLHIESKDLMPGATLIRFKMDTHMIVLMRLDGPWWLESMSLVDKYGDPKRSAPIRTREELLIGLATLSSHLKHGSRVVDASSSDDVYHNIKKCRTSSKSP